LLLYWYESLKVGTAVVTRGDGRLALGRLGALCEQVCWAWHDCFVRFGEQIFQTRGYFLKLILTKEKTELKGKKKWVKELGGGGG
jgi:hypothetical protein